MTAKMTKFCCHVTGQILRLYCFCIHLLKVPWLTTTYKPVIEDIVQVGLQSVLMIYLFFGYCSANKKKMLMAQINLTPVQDMLCFTKH